MFSIFNFQIRSHHLFKHFLNSQSSQDTLCALTLGSNPSHRSQVNFLVFKGILPAITFEIM